VAGSQGLAAPPATLVRPGGRAELVAVGCRSAFATVGSGSWAASQRVVKVLQIKVGVKIPCFPPYSQPVIASKGDATIFATGSYRSITMPVYEYESKEDGSVIELIRPMSQADAPVEDPDGKGRTFKRKHSVFSAAGTASGTASGVGGGGCCPCGKGAGACSRNN